MKACRDCRHVFNDPENGGKPGCRHPQSFTELEDLYEGRMHTYASPIGIMRRFGACGGAGALFEARDD